MNKLQRILTFSLLVVFVFMAGCRPQPATTPAAGASETPPAVLPGENSALPEKTPPSLESLLASLSLESMYTNLENLTGIQAYSGWRTSATQGEKEALDYVDSQLRSLSNDAIEIERQSFHTFLATEIRQVELTLIVNGQPVSVPVNTLRGARENIAEALKMDSDGILNDANPDPVFVDAETIFAQTSDELGALHTEDVQGKVLVVDFMIIDTTSTRETLARIYNLEPSALVVVTRYSNVNGLSHGTFLGDGEVFSRQPSSKRIPVLILRMEDLDGFESQQWTSLITASRAQITWDVDVFSPADSGNLMARIPGQNSERAILLSAHIDSANSPGALDDAGGAVILLEIARVLGEADVKPPHDLYLVWYGSEEVGLVGSANFAAVHQEVLDRLIAMATMDCLTSPIEGITTSISLASGSSVTGEDAEDPWADRLSILAEEIGIQVQRIYMPLASDNSSFAGYNVPNLNIISFSEDMETQGGVWFAGHLHDPYDTIERVKEVETDFLNTARLALATVFLPAEDNRFTSSPPATKRAVLVASHTESAHMTPAALTGLGLTLANNGYDVDVIPYGQLLTVEELETADLVLLLPVIDFPADDSAGTYDEQWQPDELDLIHSYVKRGGLLVVTNSRMRDKFYNKTYEYNEDWEAMNAVGELFGFEFSGSQMDSDQSPILSGKSPFFSGISSIAIVPQNAVPFSVSKKPFASAGSPGKLSAAVFQPDNMDGIVLVLADLLILADYPNGMFNPQLIQNIASAK